MTTVARPRALSAAEFKTVEAIAARIVPTTDTPGAIEAGAVNYIDQALAGAYARRLGIYRDSMAGLDRHCRKTYGAPFTDLSAERQDETLEALDAGTIEDVTDGSKFFDLILNHVMEGVFGDPQYGGNRDLIGWKLVGFPGQRYGYDEAYINKTVDLEPIAYDGLPRKGD